MVVKFAPCCFCGKEIEDHPPDPCRVTVETSDGKWQVWHCHGACFRARLARVPDYPPGFFDPAHF
jgi:hypothetical protein